MTSSTHRPVMVSEVLSFLPATAKLVVDLTLGEGGHAEAILRELGDGVSLIGFDRDVAALAKATRRLAALPNSTQFFHDSYANLDLHLGTEYHATVDFMLADLGFSSLQLEGTERGFSFTHPEQPLDLRFDPTVGEPLAIKLAHVSPQELTKVLAQYGELRQARAMANRIIERRREKGLHTVGDLVAAVAKFTSPVKLNKFLAQVWQALRIWVNEELEQLERGLGLLVDYLRPDGVAVVISYHSLEDRMVKDFFRTQENPCICPPRAPRCVCGRKATLQRLVRKPVRPTEDEVSANPRSRSAKLRAARRLFDS